MANGICSVDECVKPSKQRGWCWGHYSRWYRYGDPMHAFLKNCAACGDQFIPEHTRYKYCPKHTQMAMRQQAAAERAARRPTCVNCGKVCPPSLGDKDRRTCSRSCRSLYCYGGKTPRAKTADCQRCGIQIDLAARDGRGKLLNRRNVKTCKDCKKPRRYPLTARDLANLYGPNCQLCHEPVDFTKKGPHGDSPTVDHIIPWALGGSNTAENLQLACRRCNVRKGARLQPATK